MDRRAGGESAKEVEVGCPCCRWRQPVSEQQFYGIADFTCIKCRHREAVPFNREPVNTRPVVAKEKELR